MRIYALVSAYFEDSEVGRKRLKRCLDSLVIAKGKAPEVVEVKIYVCCRADIWCDESMDEYKVDWIALMEKDKTQTRHLLLKRLKDDAGCDTNDRFVFIDGDDIVQYDFFRELYIECKGDPNTLVMAERKTVLASDDGTLKVSLEELYEYIYPEHKRCATDYYFGGTVGSFVDKVLDGVRGGQIWGVAFPMSWMETVLEKLPEVSMWEDVVFWTSIDPETKLKVIHDSGAYLWVKNNPESVTSTFDKKADNKEFLLNVHTIISNLSGVTGAYHRSRRQIMRKSIIIGALNMLSLSEVEEDPIRSGIDRRILKFKGSNKELDYISCDFIGSCWESEYIEFRDVIL